MHCLDLDLQHVTSGIYLFSMNKHNHNNSNSSSLSNPNNCKVLPNKKQIINFNNKLIRSKSDIIKLQCKPKESKDKLEKLALLIENSNPNRIKSIFSTPNLMSIPKTMRFSQTIKQNPNGIAYQRNIKIFHSENVISNNIISRTKDKDDYDKDSDAFLSKRSQPKQKPKFIVKPREEIMNDKPIKQMKLVDKLFNELFKDSQNKNKSNTSFDEYNTNNSKGCQVAVSIDNNLHNIYNNPQLNHVTCLLDKKDKGEVPITYPVFLSLNNQYDTMSEKTRHEKIMDKFIKLKSLILRNLDNAHLYIKEFLLKNNITNSDYYSKEKLNCFKNFLKKTFSFDPKKTLNEIINDAVQYEPVSGDEHFIEENEGCVINHHQYQKAQVQHKSNNTQSFFRQSSNEPKSKIYSLSLDQDIFFNQVHRNKKKKDLEGLVNELESEFDRMNKEHQIQIRKINRIKNKPIMINQLTDNNVFVPNLCLGNKVFHSGIVNNLTRQKEIIENKYKHKKKIFNINRRLYYSLTNKDKEMLIKDIRRRNKLTELIILERSKKVLYITQRKEKNDKETFKRGFL